MNNSSRISNVLRNSISGIVVQATSIVLSFVVRMVFVRCLSEEYLGVSGLFSNILAILSLAELGVGNAIIYSMYKPVAENNLEEIAALMSLYRKAYTGIGCVIAILGVGLVPLLPLLVNNKSGLPDLSLIYILYLANTVVSHFYAYKRSMFIADQLESVLSKYKFYFSVLKSLVNAMVLIATKNFYLYLLVQLLCTLSENIFVSTRANKRYSFLLEFKNSKLENAKITKLFQDIKALIIYKIGGTVLDGTDNIILSVYVGLSWVGKLSNYNLLISSVSMVISQITSALTASVGNYIAKEDKSRYEELLNRITFLSFLFYGFSFVCLTGLSSQLIQLCFGSQYSLEISEVFVIALNFYIFGMMNPIWTFRTTMGLFIYGRYRPLISAVINIVVSVLLVKAIGPIGVLLGTTITRVVTNVWFDPYIVYRYGMKQRPFNYYLSWGKYLITTLISTYIIVTTTSQLFACRGTLVDLILHFVLYFFSFSSIIAIIFHKTNEFQYFWCLAKNILTSIKTNLKSS